MESRTPAFAYLRVSGPAPGDGFPRQRKAIREYATANCVHVAQYFEEKIAPGKTEWDERPAWLAMLEKITGNSIGRSSLRSSTG